MKLRYLWQRYLFKQISLTFAFVLTAFFCLYALIDYSLHMQEFVLDKKIQIKQILVYYSLQFIKRQDIMIPLALLISSLKTLFSLNTKGELVALQSSGIAKRTLLKPLFLFAFLCASFSFLSNERLLPTSLNALDKFQHEHLRHSKRNQRQEPIHVLTLSDRSKIIYHQEDPTTHLYHNVFWIKSPQEIWHMQTLSSNLNYPTGSYIDILKRNEKGNFEKTHSFDHHTFKFKVEVDTTGKGQTPLENYSISQLIKLCFKKSTLSAYEYPQALAQLLAKLLTPLLSPFVLIASAPFCLRYSRSQPLFAIYAASLFGFIALFTCIDAAILLCENLILSPYVALVIPFAILMATAYLHYQRAVSRP
jgi:lipopolysaccharide export system permease protein